MIRPTANDHAAWSHLPELTSYLKNYAGARNCCLRRTDMGDLVHDAAASAIIDHIERPDRHDPGRLSLDKYLRMAARGDFLHLLHKAIRVEEMRDAAALSALIRHVPMPEETVVLNDGVDRVFGLVPDQMERIVLLGMADGIAGVATSAAQIQCDPKTIWDIRERLRRRIQRKIATGPGR